jgi:hypothetical protein
MGKKFFRVSYEIVTQESAEHGDAEERGSVLPGEWREPVETKEDVTMGLRDAMRLAHPLEDSGSWWQEIDGRCDHRTSAVEYRAIHPPKNITAASYARVSRLLGFK